MTLAGLRERLNHLRERLPIAWHGLPHGCNVYVDIARRLVRNRIDMIFDVGANYGQSAEEFKRWYPAATIHSFEPVATTCRVLQSRVGRLRGVHVHQVGFGEIPGSQTIAVAADPLMSRVGSTDGVHSEQIEIDTVDAFCRRTAIEQIDFLKIDTEGQDLSVLKGGACVLGEGRAAIVQVEAGMNMHNRFHASADDLIDFLRSRQYALFGIYEQTLEWTTADAFLRRANLVFVSPETVRRNHWSA